MANFFQITLITIIAALLPTPVQAQKTPTAAELFDHTDKITGTVALSSISTIKAYAHVTVGERSYDTTVNAAIVGGKIGDAQFTIIRDNIATTYSDTKGALEIKVGDTAPKALPASMKAFIQGHQFHRRVLFPRMEFASHTPLSTESEFAGTSSYRVQGKATDGSELSYHFDRNTQRMLGFQLTVMEENGPRPMNFVLKDWRTKAGQTLFWRLEISDKEDLYVYAFNKILLLP